MADRPAPGSHPLRQGSQDQIATITFNRPEFLNAASAARLRYADLLRAATVDNDVKVVVIRGVGDNLGSGADLPEFGGQRQSGAAVGVRLEATGS